MEQEGTINQTPQQKKNKKLVSIILCIIIVLTGLFLFIKTKYNVFKNNNSYKKSQSSDHKAAKLIMIQESPASATTVLSQFTLPLEYQNIQKDKPVFSRDMQHIAFHIDLSLSILLTTSPSVDIMNILAYQKPEFYIIDSVKQAEYKQVSNFVFSPNGKNYAYIVVKQNGKQAVIENGVEGKEYDTINLHFTPVFSPDSSILAYEASHDGQVVLVLNGKEQKSYKDIMGFKFSPDSKHYSDFSRLNDTQWEVVLDGKEITESDDVSDFYFSKNSEHYAYTTWIGAQGTLNNSLCIYFDGLKQQCGASLGSQYAFADNSNFSYYIESVDGSKGFLSLKGSKSIFSYPKINLRFTPNGEHYYYNIITDANKDCHPGPYFFIDGKSIPNFSAGAEDIVVSLDSKLFAFTQDEYDKSCSATHTSIETMSLNGKRTILQIFPTTQVNKLQIAPDNKTVVYVTHENIVALGSMFFDNTYSRIYGDVNSPFMSDLTISPDSKKVAYLTTMNNGQTGENMGMFFTVNNKKMKEYDNIYQNPIFSADSNALFYPVSKTNQYYWIKNTLY